MAEPKGKLVTPVGFDPTGYPRAFELTADDYLKVVMGDASLSDLLTELEQKLATADLNIEAVTKDLQVDVKSSALPTNAATDDTLYSLLTELLQKLEPGDLNIEATTKHLQVDVVAAPTTTVTQTTPANLVSATHGYVNSAWQKNPLQFGYSNALAVLASRTTLPAGSSSVNSAACPAGRIWVVTHVSFYAVSTTLDYVTIEYSAAGTFVGIFKQLTPVSYMIYDRQGWWVLKAGDILRISVADATLNDDVFLTAGGFYVDINL